jgi:hypothetical protein
MYRVDIGVKMSRPRIVRQPESARSIEHTRQIAQATTVITCIFMPHTNEYKSALLGRGSSALYVEAEFIKLF